MMNTRVHTVRNLLALLVLLALGVGGALAPAQASPALEYVGDIGSGTIKDDTNDDLVVTTSAAVAAGDDIIIAYATDPTQDLHITVSDSAGNEYQRAAMTINMGNLRTYVFAAYHVNALASGSQITIHQTFYSTTIPAARAAVVSVFRGLAPEGALEQTSNDNGSSTTPSSGAATTVQAEQLLIGAVGTEGPSGDAAGTWGGSFTAGPRAGTTGGTADTNITVSMAWRIVSAAGAYNASKSGITSRNWAAAIATFKTTDAGISYLGDIGSAQSKTAGTSLAVTTNAAVASGDDIIVAFAADPSATVSSVSDSAGNTYNQAVDVSNSGDVRTYIFAAYNVNALSSGSTITINHASVSARAAVVSAFRGLANSAVLDQTHTGTGSSTSPTSGATSTTTQADELLIGAIGMEGPNVDNPGTWSNSFTDGLRLGTSFGSSSGDDTDVTASMGWRIVGATGAYTAAKSGLATSRDWAAAIATFKAAMTRDLTMAVDPVGGGTTDPAVGVHTYAYGSVVDITATPAVGYEFDHWSGDCTGSGACQVTMNADKSVTAHFTLVTHDLTTAVDPVGGGTTDPAVGVHTYAYGSVVDITATPAVGYEFDHWSGDCTGSGACQVTLDADRSVTAHFTLVTHDLTMAVDPVGGGTTDPAAGVHAYAYGSVVDITATPAVGYAFDHWSGDCTGSGACQVTMNADKSVTAHFTVVTHDLTMAVDPVGGGTTDPAAGVHTYAYGSVVDITATPAVGYEFNYWSGDCTGSGACQVTMDADKSVTAHFTVSVISYDLTIAVDPVGGGTTNPSVGVHTYAEGTVVDITATRNGGYVFDHWSGDCTGSGACQVAIDADKGVTAHFKRIVYLPLVLKDR
jgi:hypothetical protein